MAQAILACSYAWPGGTASRRAESPLFPPVSSFKLRHSPASFPTPSGFRCLDSRSRRSGNMSSRKAWSRRLAVPRCGDGSAAMPSALGSIEAGSSLAIPTLRSKPVRSSIYTNAFGKAPRLALTTMSFPRTKRPAFKLAAGNIPLCHLLPTGPCA